MAWLSSGDVRGESWYARGEQVRTLDSFIDWLRDLWKLHDVFATDPAVAALLPA